MTNTLEDLGRLTEAVRSAGADIAPAYIEYIQLAYAIANDCGEAGRGYFIQLCSLSAKYNAGNAEKTFTNALRNGNNTVHINTVFYLAGQCGVKLTPSASAGTNGTLGTVSTGSKFHACARTYNTESENRPEDDVSDQEQLIEGSEPYSPLPVFPQDYHWPKLLDKAIRFGETREQRDVLLLGALTVIGASLGRNMRCMYSHKWQYPCMQSFIVAPPASGKGVLAWVRLLVEPIHDEIRRQVAEQMKQYRLEKSAYEVLGKERAKVEAPILPPNRMFIISGNNTGTGILQNVMDSDGTGIIIEPEADTVSVAIGSEYGNWSDTLRKAFDNAPLSYNRRTDREYREVGSTFLSVLLSGTPAQVLPLIPSAENGLFSRQIFYYMPSIREWVDQFCENELDVEGVFQSMDREWKKNLDALKEKGIITLYLTAEQKKEFNKLFRALFQRSSISNGSEMSSSVVRLAINACRMMSVVAVLRDLDENTCLTPDSGIPADNLKDGIITRWRIAIGEDDFHAVLALVEPLYSHATHILSFLSSSLVKSRTMADKDQLFASMPETFTRRQLLERAEEASIPENTVNGWLKRLTKRGVLTNVDGKGTYHKGVISA